MMTTNRDTFLAFEEVLRELAANGRRAQQALEERLLRENDLHAELVAWVRERNAQLLHGLEALAAGGPEELLRRRVQYTPDEALRRLPENGGLLVWVLEVNNQALTVLADLEDKTLAPEVEETLGDLVTQLEGINRRIALALNTAQDL